MKTATDTKPLCFDVPALEKLLSKKPAANSAEAINLLFNSAFNLGFAGQPPRDFIALITSEPVLAVRTNIPHCEGLVVERVPHVKGSFILHWPRYSDAYIMLNFEGQRLVSWSVAGSRH